MRIATYNVEWFHSLFDESNQLWVDHAWSARRNVTRREQTEALVRVFSALDADAVMIIEAPESDKSRDTCAALENFAHRYGIRARRAVMGFASHTQQEIAFLYDPDRLEARHDPVGSADGGVGNVPRFDAAFDIDLDIDNRMDRVQFSKPPLELSVTIGTHTPLRVIGVHLKSKAPHGASGRDEIMRASIANRRKQLAQAIWLRARIDEHLSAGESLIVLGDLNDGPGLDEYENLFGRSSVEIVMGENGSMPLFDPHAVHVPELAPEARPKTSRFYLEGSGHHLQALLDYVMISPDLRVKSPKWSIWHPFDNPNCRARPDLQQALLTASDHFPVVLDIAL